MGSPVSVSIVMMMSGVVRRARSSSWATRYSFWKSSDRVRPRSGPSPSIVAVPKLKPPSVRRSMPVIRPSTRRHPPCSASSASTGGRLSRRASRRVAPSRAARLRGASISHAFAWAPVITVGRFNAVGTLIALYLLNIFVTGLQLFGAQPWVSDVFNGCALILAVTFARIASRMSGRA